jgi:hypothetical protein
MLLVVFFAIRIGGSALLQVTMRRQEEFVVAILTIW